MKMREYPKNKGPTCDLPCTVTFPKNTHTHDPRVDTHVLVIGFRTNTGKTTSSKQIVYLSKTAA